MAHMDIHSEHAQLDQINMHYLDTKTKGETIICIHGLWGRGETWKSFMYKYAEQYRIIAPDLRGHGYSSKPSSPYTAKVMCDDIAELMNHLNVENAVILGHSQGGRVAAHLAVYHPKLVTKVAILDKSASGHDPSKIVDNSVVHQDPLTHDWPLPFKNLEEARIFIQDEMNNPLSYDYFMLSLSKVDQGYDMLFSQNAIGSLKANDTSWFHILPKIKCPTLIMRTSSHEAISNEDWSQIKSLISDCTAVEMSHPDHNVHLANPEEFYTCIDDFISN